MSGSTFDKNGDRHSALMVNGERKIDRRMIVDYGASTNMVKHKELLQDPVPSAPTMFSIGVGRKLKSTTQGSVVISTSRRKKTQKKLLWPNAIYVPDLETNLVSCAELSRTGHLTVCGEADCQILHDGEVIATAELGN